MNMATKDRRFLKTVKNDYTLRERPFDFYGRGNFLKKEKYQDNKKNI